LLKACGIGKLRPNILLMGHKSDWQKCSKDDLDQYFGVLQYASPASSLPNKINDAFAAKLSICT
jgi:hypothetical protein